MSELESESEVSDVVPKKEEKTRKRKATDEDQEELEIDVNLPEPPSKKARRKEKKGKLKKTATNDGAVADQLEASEVTGAAESQTASKRSEYGIWIGNLPFSATPDKLREFFQDKGDIDSREIVRLNMPGPPGQKKEKNANGPSPIEDNPRTPQNKGFAYVDFTTKEVQDKALALSETLLVGRRVLIKDAKSFAGRPEVAKGGDGTANKGSGKEPSKKVFVGNLGFDVTKEDLTEVLGKAGTVEDCFLATFEDTGKCKGFGWVRFKEIEGAQAAVKGFLYEEADEVEDDDQEAGEDAAASKKKRNSRKKTWVNMLNGRPLRCEFAEDANTRYKKRFGKDKGKPGAAERTTNQYATSGDAGDSRPFANNRQFKPERRDRSGDKEQRRDDRRKRHDARMIAPGQALAKAPRATAAIVEGAGKKTSFD